jgi:antirestriction protein ArdC
MQVVQALLLGNQSVAEWWQPWKASSTPWGLLLPLPASAGGACHTTSVPLMSWGKNKTIGEVKDNVIKIKASPQDL